MKTSAWTFLFACLAAAPRAAIGLKAGDADDVYNSFNNVFLVKNGNDVFYKATIDKDDPDRSWTGSFDIMVAIDVYERTGDQTVRGLVYELLTTWLGKTTPPPWDWDGWNDDIGWFTLALIRGYRVTGTQSFLDNAKYGFDYAFGRGWDTDHNDGGIWEQQPKDTDKPLKEALSNDSLGKVACMIYQNTGDQGYLHKCRQIYDWVRNHIYNSNTGQVDRGVDPQGNVDTGTAVYSQGTFADFANLLWLITGDRSFYDDAMKAIDFARQNLTSNGIFSNNQDYLQTWADEMGRAAGNFAKDNRQWDKYYLWMVNNANAILDNRRSDLGITWNAWNTPTPQNNSLSTNKFASAVAWLQYTPPNKPGGLGGIHSIINAATGKALDSGINYGSGEKIITWTPNPSIYQRWLLAQNTIDSTWILTSLFSWMVIDCLGGSTKDGDEMIQWGPNRDPNQRWSLEPQSNDAYRIVNKKSGLVLDGGSDASNGTFVKQKAWTGSKQQLWHII